MAVFSTWSALLEQIKNDMANFKPGIREYIIGGKTIKYATFRELREAYDWVTSMAAEEAGSRAPRRTLAKNGRGRW